MREIFEKMNGRKVLVIGDVMLDGYVHGGVNRISPEAPVPVVEVQRRENRAGGAANVALGAAALGVHADLVGVCGTDLAGKALIEILERKGVGCEGLLMREEAPTIFKERVLANGSQQICRLDSEGPAELYKLLVDEAEEKLLRAKVAQSDAVIVSDYAKGVVTDALLRVVADEAKQKGRKIPVLLDPKPKNRVDFAGRVDVITPNRKEALLLAGYDASVQPFPAEEVCAELHKRWALPYLVVTMSEEGFLLTSREGACHRERAYIQRLCDVTGAGDTFVAALGCALASGVGMLEAAKLANMAAGVVVGKPGTATATPEEILEHLSLIALRREHAAPTAVALESAADRC